MKIEIYPAVAKAEAHENLWYWCCGIVGLKDDGTKVEKYHTGSCEVNADIAEMNAVWVGMSKIKDKELPVVVSIVGFENWKALRGMAVPRENLVSWVNVYSRRCAFEDIQFRAIKPDDPNEDFQKAVAVVKELAAKEG